jgi:hypothetical protein
MVGASGGQVSSSINEESGDARAVIYAKIAEEERQKDQVRKQKEIYDSMVERGIIKPYKDSTGTTVVPDFAKDGMGGTTQRQQAQDPIPWMFLLSVLAGVLLAMGILGGLLVWVLLTFFND